MKLSMDLLKKNLYWVISIALFGLALIFSVVMLITLEVSVNADQTSIGFIFLGNVKEDEYDQTIYQGINTWKTQAQYHIFYQGYEIPIDMDLFEFDIDETKNQLKKNQDNHAYFSIDEIKQEAFMDQLLAMLGPTVINGLDETTFFSDLIEDAMTLSRVKNYHITDYLNLDLTQVVLKSSQITQINAADVTAISSFVDVLHIDGLERFSLLDMFGQTELTNEQLSIIASGILGLLAESPMLAFDFIIYQDMPMWADEGMNVRILRLNQYDLTFYNPLSDSLTVEITQVSPTSLSFELIGFPLVTVHESVHYLETAIPFVTYIVDDETIDAATPGIIITETDTEFIYDLIVQSGINGSIYVTERTTTRYQSSSETITLFREHYLPVDEIIHRHVVSKGG